MNGGVQDGCRMDAGEGEGEGWRGGEERRGEERGKFSRNVSEG